jgi:hypothetical protein
MKSQKKSSICTWWRSYCPFSSFFLSFSSSPIMTDQNTSNLLNLLTIEVLSTKAAVNTLSDKVDNLAGEMTSMKDILNQILARVSAHENNDNILNPLHEQSLARPNNPNDKLAVLKAALGTTLATEGFAIDSDQAYAHVSDVANKLVGDLTPANYKTEMGTTKANWKDLRPEVKTVLITELTRKAKKRHIHLDRCVNNWAAKEIIRRKILNKAGNEAKRLKKSLVMTSTSANTTSTASPRDNDNDSDSANATSTISTGPSNCAK